MSRTLCCRLVLETQRSPVYWWPLIFEAMARQSFCFYDRELIAGVGHYSFFRLDDTTYGPQSEVVTKPFRALWEEVYTGVSGMLVTFWHEGSDRFTVDVDLSVGEERTLDLTLSLAGAEVAQEPEEMERSEEEVRKRLHILLTSSQALYELCQPCRGELAWEFAGCRYAAWASFGEPPTGPSAERPAYGGPETKLVVKLMGEAHGESQKYLYVLDPVPLPASKAKEWSFLSLFANP